MPKDSFNFKFNCLFLALLALVGCAARNNQATLADLDISDSKSTRSKVFVKQRSQEDIKKAYYEYIRNASKSDKSRQTAINRIAAMELSLTNKLLEESDVSGDEDISDQLYLDSLENAATLLSTSLNDFPDAENNDSTLYQLARTLDQLGRGEEGIVHLETLVSKYTDSPFYAEAQFRLGEYAFASGNFLIAEAAYTEVILTPVNDRFYEKSLFKRGWTRYKQSLYNEAVDDYFQALTYHRFDDIEKLNESERDQFDEYFRAIGLVFSHLQGARSLHEYFADRANFKYLYHTYSVVADIYVKQERYSDAAETMRFFIDNYSDAVEAPKAQLKIVSIWQQGNFTDQLHDEVEVLFSKYNANSDYWKSHDLAKKAIQDQLRGYAIDLATFHHSQYQKRKQNRDFQNAKKWYTRYIDQYSNFAKQDKVYERFADLLAAEGEQRLALKYFEIAAYDGELVLDKKAAYGTVSLSNDLYQSTAGDEKKQWLDKHIEYAYRYASLYSDDESADDIIAYAAELAFNNQRYEKSIELAQVYKPRPNSRNNFIIGNIKARSFLDSGDHSGAEAAFTDLLSESSLSNTERQQVKDSIALAIYKSGEEAKAQGDIELAVHHFGRISRDNPESSIAATGLYDAGSLAITNKLWDSAIFHLERFQGLYPSHQYAKEATRQLSVAYLQSDQKDKAAQQFEQLAKVDESREVKMTALWQAAQLYDERKDIDAAIRAYRDYAHTYTDPYPQNMEAMYRLSELYIEKQAPQKRYFWQNKIRTTDARASQKNKTDRTNFIASTTVLDLAEQQKRSFTRTRLVEPLAKNLKIKKQHMQEAIKLYGQASSYNISEITTKSTFQIADIYQSFSQALLESERPSNLNAEELEQYDILLEDQAFPFEEKAIEFYETNLARVKDGTYNEWIESSYQHLTELFPVRFARKPKVEAVFYD